MLKKTQVIPVKKVRKNKGPQSHTRRLTHPTTYESFDQIDGQHPFKKQTAFSYIDYPARKRKGGEVIYFNYELAKELGLIHSKHAATMTPRLQAKILDTFAIQIINEHDYINKKKYAKEDIKKHSYMATRYLQLQHPGSSGITSGDGRSLWNGTVTHKGTTWDITSCGTGATCLSPATANNDIFYKTGDKTISYGCGYAEVSEGIANAIMSEILHKKGINTERTLAVIQFPGELAINVRAGKNLIRPSHMFNHLKQGRLDRLKMVVDYAIDRQIKNHQWLDFTPGLSAQQKYDKFFDHMLSTFAKMSAQLESHYIFCWLEWDGDNILMDGGIIDYGSIRQFGLFHRMYRYDDVERWSTNITEQKLKAKLIVQTFLQMTEALKTGVKKPLNTFKNHPKLRRFDKIFTETCQAELLKKIGFDQKTSERLIKKNQRLVSSFQKAFQYFERAVSTRGPIRLEDGITTNAIFCMRDILRELPAYYKIHKKVMSTETFMDTILTQYATKKDKHISAYRKSMIADFQKLYLRLTTKVSAIEPTAAQTFWDDLARRSLAQNPTHIVTGNGVIFITDTLLKLRKKTTADQWQLLIDQFIQGPQSKQKSSQNLNSKPLVLSLEKYLSKLQSITYELRETI